MEIPGPTTSDEMSTIPPSQRYRLGRRRNPHPFSRAQNIDQETQSTISTPVRQETTSQETTR